MMLIKAGDQVSERGRKIFFIPKHHIYIRRNAAINFLRIFFPTDRLPKRCTIVQIIGNDCAVAFGRLHCFQGNFGCCDRECTKNTASMKPASALFAKYLVPVNIARFKLRDCCISTVVRSGRSAYAEASFGEVQPVSCGAADAVVLYPAHQGLVYSALIQEVLKQPPRCIISECSHYCHIQSEAALQTASDVVFSSALAHFKCPRGCNPPVARIEAKHNFAQTDQVPAAILLSDCQSHLCLPGS